MFVTETGDEMTVRAPLAILAACLIAACADNRDGAIQAADLVLMNGRVKTPEGWAQAIAISGASIVAVGDRTAVGARVGPATTVVDLEGKTVLPGFHDMHVHPVYGGIMYSGADYTNCRIEQGSSEEALLETLEGCVSRVTGSEWVTGGQWDAAALGRPPHRSALDRVAPNTPVVINDTSGHSAWANTAALRLAGIKAATPDPPGGIIERDADGEPTGVLRESATGLVRLHVPRPSAEVIRASLEWSLQTMLSYGITSFTEASLGFVGGTSRELDAYVGIADDGRLKQRVRVCMRWAPDGEEAEEGDGAEAVRAARDQYERERLTLDCVKIFLDGVPTDSHTAAMLEPYANTIPGRDDEASRYGMLLIRQDLIDEAVTRFDDEGLTVKFHAAGDAAVRSGLDAIEAARQANGMSSVRHDVGHNTFIAVEDLGRAAALNASFELSPYLWSPSPINDDITRAIGAGRIRRVWPFREAIDAGALVVPGSDWSVVPSVNPWLAVEALVTRRAPGGGEESFGPEQAISVEEAIDLFTVNSAAHMGNRDRLGQLREGMLADLIVLDRNPYQAAETDLHETEVLLTIINGETVFDRAGAGSALDQR